MNARLRVAIAKAREASMPKENIERAVKRGVGGDGEGLIESLMYEAYAPGGTALIIECLTDSRNRTSNDVKHLLSKAGGSLATSGAVTFSFDHCGIVRVPGGLSKEKRDEIEMALIEAGATDIVDEEEATEVRSHVSDFGKVTDAIAKLALPVDVMEFQWIPKSLVETDEATGTSVAELIETLEELDDVSRVFSNLA